MSGAEIPIIAALITAAGTGAAVAQQSKAQRVQKRAAHKQSALLEAERERQQSEQRMAAQSLWARRRRTGNAKAGTVLTQPLDTAGAPLTTGGKTLLGS